MIVLLTQYIIQQLDGNLKDFDEENAHEAIIYSYHLILSSILVLIYIKIHDDFLPDV